MKNMWYDGTSNFQLNAMKPFDYKTLVGSNGGLIPKRVPSAPILPGYPDVPTSAYCSIHGVEPKRCLECDRILKVLSFKKGWVEDQTYCSNECKDKSPVRYEKTKRTCMERYGVSHPSKNESIKEKVKKTNLERYGVENFSQTEDFKESYKKTMMDRYGVSHALQSDVFKEKFKTTSLERYGVSSYSQTEDFKDKAVRTTLERYGVSSYSQTDEYKERVKKTSLERFGVPSYSNTEEYKERVRQTNMERYGVAYPMQEESVMERVRQTNMERYGVPYYYQTEDFKEKFKATSMERYGVSHPLQSDVFKKKAKKTFKDRYGVVSYAQTDEYKERVKETNMERYGVPWFFQSKEFQEKMRSYWDENVSRPQLRTLEFLLDIDDSIEFKINDRELLSPLEVDILLPEKKIAIEVNGVYWHSSTHKDENYHLDKTGAALKKGWRLLHFWDYEVLEFPEVVKEVLNNSLEDKVPPGDVLDRRFYPHVEGVKTPPRLVSVGPYKCWDCGCVIVE